MKIQLHKCKKNKQEIHRLQTEIIRLQTELNLYKNAYEKRDNVYENPTLALEHIYASIKKSTPHIYASLKYFSDTSFVPTEPPPSPAPPALPAPRQSAMINRVPITRTSVV